MKLTLECTMGVEPTSSSGRGGIRTCFCALSSDAELIGYEVSIHQVGGIGGEYSHAILHIET